MTFSKFLNSTAQRAPFRVLSKTYKYTSSNSRSLSVMAYKVPYPGNDIEYRMIVVDEFGDRSFTCTVVTDKPSANFRYWGKPVVAWTSYKRTWPPWIFDIYVDQSNYTTLQKIIMKEPGSWRRDCWLAQEPNTDDTPPGFDPDDWFSITCKKTND